MKRIIMTLTLAVGVFLGLMFFFPATVHAAQNGWVKINQKTYYYQNGKPVTGIKEISNDLYYFNPAGEMKTGKITHKGKTYYFNPKTGRIYFGWVKLNNKDCYFSMNGTVGTHIKVKTVKGNYKKGTGYGPKLSSSQRKATKKQVVAFMNKYIATNMTQFEKVSAAHDYLCNRASYSTSSKVKSNTAYGALVKKKAQCVGYSRAFKALCDAMGIGCKNVRATNLSHQWNMVKVDKNWYHIDVQTNDSSHFYAIFLISDNLMKKAGVRWKKSLPKCTKNYEWILYYPE